jgi:uncharacterized protein YggU (UPF0235/DUF167 family)
MYIKVAVIVNSKKENFVQKNKDHFEISVKDKAENNMANKKVIELLAKHFDISTKSIRIINGHHHPHKLLIVDEKI